MKPDYITLIVNTESCSISTIKKILEYPNIEIDLPLVPFVAEYFDSLVNYFIEESLFERVSVSIRYDILYKALIMDTDYVDLKKILLNFSKIRVLHALHGNVSRSYIEHWTLTYEKRFLIPFQAGLDAWDFPVGGLIEPVVVVYDSAYKRRPIEGIHRQNFVGYMINLQSLLRVEGYSPEKERLDDSKSNYWILHFGEKLSDNNVNNLQKLCERVYSLDW